MSERTAGVLVKWLADRGFGFLSHGDHYVFVSADAFDHAGLGVPSRGERFSFVVDTDRHGRPRATDLRREGAAAAAERAFKHEPVRP